MTTRRSGEDRVAVVGGGIIGLAVARRMLQARPGACVTVLEKEDAVGTHQSGRNSGVVHAGLYYQPGSLKARLCRRGVGMLREYCQESGVVYEECGKLLVALAAEERPRLDDIHRRADQNGVPGLSRLGPAGIRDVEPHGTGLEALHSPRTAITDFGGVCRALAAEVERLGGRIRTGSRVTGLRPVGDRVQVDVAGPAQEQPVGPVGLVVACAGLHSDRLAAASGASPAPRIVPFRGEYHLLRPAARPLVRGLIYPVPDPRYPFLGIHLTRRWDGGVLVGPNAVLALSREGYGWGEVNLRDLRESLAYRGLRKLAARHWRTGAREVWRSVSRRAFVREARRYLPGLRVSDVVRGPAGVRAQALDRDGGLVDDFLIERHGPVVHLRNAPSPGATSSLAIAEHLVGQLGW